MSRGEESDDEQIKYAIALSLKDQGDADGKQVLPEVNYKPSEAPSLDLLSLNRKQMEEDRLARIATKRSRMLSNEEEVVETPPPKRRTKSETYPTADGAVIPYPEGIVKRTWVRGYDRSNDDIKIEEVLQKDKLLLALFSSFQWDEPWLFNKIDASRTKVLLVAFAADETQKEITRRNAPSNVKFCFPDMHGPGSMHSKLQILKFPNYLRIVIPTGNLVPYDWGETGVMENMVFLIDLPLMEMAHKPHPATMFFSQLQLYLQAMGVEISMISGLSKYDFSKTKDIGLVYSIPGAHSGNSFSEVGFSSLSTTIATLGLATSESVDIDIACASLGAIKYDLIEAMYSACQGDVNKILAETKQGIRSKHEQHQPSTLRQHFRIYFPSYDTVAESRGGKTAAGTICFQEKWWRTSTFPTELMRDCVNTRNGLLMHSKIILVRHTHKASGNVEPRKAWAYVGSANLSESAWGRTVKDKASGERKIVCRNWECGIVIPVRAVRDVSRPMDMDIFQGTIPIPMHVPGRRYSQDEHPWFFHKELKR